MEILRKLRFIFYPLVFLLVFLFASYCTFPKDVLRDMAQTSITTLALGLGPKNRGLPQVLVDDVSLWRFSGLSLKGLNISWSWPTGQLPITMQFDSLKGRLGIFSWLMGGKNILFMSQLYGGEINANIKLRRQNAFGFLEVNAAKVNLGKMQFFEALLGAPLQGILSIGANMNANSELTKDGTGFIKFNIENLVYGPGSIHLPLGGFVSSLTVPEVKMGKFSAEFTLDKGQLTSKTLSLSGGDVEAELKMIVSLGRMPSSSRITGDGWFSAKRDFVNSNETLKMLYDLIPELKEAQQGSGKVGLTIRGNLAHPPQMRLERYTETPKAEPEAKK